MKQSARIKLLTFLFLLTGIGASLILLKNTGWNTSEASALDISVDSSSLRKITLRYGTTTTLLSKEGSNSWKVNGQYKVRPNLIQLMIVGLSKAEIKRPVSSENKAKVLELLKQKGVEVKVEGGDWHKTFLLSSNDNDANSSYYLEAGSTEPYVVYVPGFSGDMANLFKMDEASWRSRELFISTPLSLQKISVSYPTLKNNNVEIRWNADKTFEVSGISSQVDTGKVLTYLAQFEQVNVDSYLSENKETILAELRKSPPQAIIEVSDLNPSGSHKLSVYGESKEPKGLYAIIEPENEPVIMKPETLFRLLVRKDFFEKKKK